MLTEQQKSYEHSRGFLEEWLKTCAFCGKATPGTVLEHLQNLTNGLVVYRDLVSILTEDLESVRQRYIDLTKLSANYLEIISRYESAAENLIPNEQTGSQS